MKHRRLKLFAATMACIFNLFVCFAGCYAWFVTSKTNSASNMAVQMYTHELDLQYRVFKYDEDLEVVREFGKNEDQFTLIDYDSILTERNEHTPIIIEFTIDGMSIGGQNPIDLSVLCSQSSATSRALSNIVRFKFSQIPSIVETSAETIYSSALDYLEDEDNHINDMTFAIDPNDNTQKATTLTYSLSSYATSTVKIYGLLDYSESLITLHNFKVATFTGNTPTQFIKDLTTIQCAA